MKGEISKHIFQIEAIFSNKCQSIFHSQFFNLKTQKNTCSLFRIPEQFHTQLSRNAMTTSLSSGWNLIQLRTKSEELQP